MTLHSWEHIFIPSSKLPNLPENLPSEMIVYKAQDNRLYYFANTVAWCLGHQVPHKAVEQFVDKNNIHYLDWGSGKFLTKVGIYQLMLKSKSRYSSYFLSWHSQYEQNNNL